MHTRTDRRVSARMQVKSPAQSRVPDNDAPQMRGRTALVFRDQRTPRDRGAQGQPWRGVAM